MWPVRWLSRLVLLSTSRLNLLLVAAELKFLCFSWRWPPHDWSWLTRVISASLETRSCSLLLLFRGHVPRLNDCLMLLFLMWHFFTIWTLFVDPAAPLSHRRDSILHPQLKHLRSAPSLIVNCHIHLVVLHLLNFLYCSFDLAIFSLVTTHFPRLCIHHDVLLSSPRLSPQVSVASPLQTGHTRSSFSLTRHSNLESSCSYVVMALYSFESHPWSLSALVDDFLSAGPEHPLVHCHWHYLIIALHICIHHLLLLTSLQTPRPTPDKSEFQLLIFLSCACLRKRHQHCATPDCSTAITDSHLLLAMLLLHWFLGPFPGCFLHGFLGSDPGCFLHGFLGSDPGCFDHHSNSNSNAKSLSSKVRRRNWHALSTFEWTEPIQLTTSLDLHPLQASSCPELPDTSPPVHWHNSWSNARPWRWRIASINVRDDCLKLHTDRPPPDRVLLDLLVSFTRCSSSSWSSPPRSPCFPHTLLVLLLIESSSIFLFLSLNQMTLFSPPPLVEGEDALLFVLVHSLFFACGWHCSSFACGWHCSSSACGLALLFFCVRLALLFFFVLLSLSLLLQSHFVVVYSAVLADSPSGTSDTTAWSSVRGRCSRFTVEVLYNNVVFCLSPFRFLVFGTLPRRDSWGLQHHQRGCCSR